jgi:hypothetical protein
MDGRISQTQPLGKEDKRRCKCLQRAKLSRLSQPMQLHGFGLCAQGFSSGFQAPGVTSIFVHPNNTIYRVYMCTCLYVQYVRICLYLYMRTVEGRCVSDSVPRSIAGGREYQRKLKKKQPANWMFRASWRLPRSEGDTSVATCRQGLSGTALDRRRPRKGQPFCVSFFSFFSYYFFFFLYFFFNFYFHFHLFPFPAKALPADNKRIPTV